MWRRNLPYSTGRLPSDADCSTSLEYNTGTTVQYQKNCRPFFSGEAGSLLNEIIFQNYHVLHRKCMICIVHVVRTVSVILGICGNYCTVIRSNQEVVGWKTYIGSSSHSNFIFWHGDFGVAKASPVTFCSRLNQHERNNFWSQVRLTSMYLNWRNWRYENTKLSRKVYLHCNIHHVVAYDDSTK